MYQSLRAFVRQHFFFLEPGRLSNENIQPRRWDHLSDMLPRVVSEREDLPSSVQAKLPNDTTYCYFTQGGIFRATPPLYLATKPKIQGIIATGWTASLPPCLRCEYSRYAH